MLYASNPTRNLLNQIDNWFVAMDSDRSANMSCFEQVVVAMQRSNEVHNRTEQNLFQMDVQVKVEYIHEEIHQVLAL